jgi:N-acetylneuraminic acid mutarotase
MIIWGGWANYPNFYGNGIKFNPSTNSLTAISNIAAPAARQGHTAVWTGTEMIVWGGGYMPNAFDWSNFNNGGRYNPVTNTWTSMSTTGAPVARGGHVAVWTGTEMIIWGGLGTSLSGSWNDGGRYNPQTNTWTAISSVNAPSGRHYARAFWTGSKMIVWGGQESYAQSTLPNSGGIYDPATDSWTTISNTVLTGRFGMVAAWTGTEMLVWGGQDGMANYGDGARFNPATMTWTKIMATGAPSARSFGTNAHIGGVWSGTRLIFFGGLTSAYAPLAGTYLYDPDPAQNVELTLKFYRK